MPKASKEKIDAIVFKTMWEDKHIRKEFKDPELTLKPDMSKTNKSRRTKKYYHTGKWEMSRFDDGEYAWSCCQNSQEDDQGCQLVIVDPDRLNIASF